MRLIYEFTVPGDPKGYYAAGKNPNWTRLNQYIEYKKHVHNTALRKFSSIGLLKASKDEPLVINTVAYFRDGRHPDPENVHKGIVDALFYGAKGGDKYTGGGFPPPLYDKDNPRVEVSIWEGSAEEWEAMAA